MSKPRVIASRVVSRELQERFAALSGDRNPMHMDEIAARRTQAGLPVVHGVHTLLWALDSLAAAGSFTSALVRVKAKFLKWVYLGDDSVLSLPLGEPSNPRLLQVAVLGMPVLTAELSFGEYAGEYAPADPPSCLAPSPAAPLTSAIDRSFADLEDSTGNAFTAPAADASAFFPYLGAFISGTTVAEIAACSYLVGMEAPGLHSMFSKLDLTLRPAVEPAPLRTGLHYLVSYLDERFRKVRLQVTGRGIGGTLEILMRLPPVAQASMQAAAELVSPSEFAGMEALIIGGSRGLGELTAKLIAAGGGKPTLTYAVGKAEAEDVAGQIRQAGGKAAILQYDVLKSPEPQLAGLTSPITHVFYYATNAIFRPKHDLVSPPILRDFIAFYLQGFHDLCLQLMQSGKPYTPDSAKLIVYYPSSIAVEERPAGMTEYAMVKAAGEQMCRDMNEYVGGLRILMSRLPRLRTDQTASVIPERDLDPITVILPIIRQMQGMTSER